jgi:hypothetical protein
MIIGTLHKTHRLVVTVVVVVVVIIEIDIVLDEWWEGG